MRPLAFALAALLLLVASRAPAQAVDLRLTKETGGIRLSWSGGDPDFDAYVSADPRRVVSPARVLGTTSANGLSRATPDPDEPLLYFEVGCAGAGCEERCFGGADDDGDGLADCDDGDCAGSPDCGVEAACTNGLDDDGDDLADCDDPDCRACDDGDACTADSCDPGEPSGCRHDPITCDDLDACTMDACDPAAGCVSTPVACDDGDACNGLETCDTATGDCAPGTPVACDDGDACNGLEACDATAGDCLPGTPVICDDGDACNGVETCDAATGACMPGTPVICDDGDACNGLETCDAATGACVPGTPAACGDGDACNGVEICDPATGACLPGTPVGCDDGDACTADACDPATGCTSAPVACDDLDACTDDACDPAAGCVFTPRDCDDGAGCTIDTCDPAAGCLHAVDPAVAPARHAELAGRSLPQYPWFAHVTAFNASAPVDLGADTSRLPELAGLTCDAHVVAARSDAEWCADRSLADVRGAPVTVTFAASGTRANRFPLIAAGELSAATSSGFGAGLDVVLDCDRDGILDPTDWIDGLGAEAGLYLVHDLTQPGPHSVASFEQVGPLPPWPGPWLGGEGDDVRVAYPAELDDPSFVGTFPLVLVNHGNGHSFAWYSSLQDHLASYGYVVAAHDVDTGWGIEEASSSALAWTDWILANQAVAGGGVLDGHLDARRIAWIGHSRGGEGVVRAYDRLHDESFTPAQFAIGDVRLVVSMAPTDFLGPGAAHPHGVPYALLYGASDGDVSGCVATGDIAMPFHLYERAFGEKSVTYVHGASHSDFHDCGMGGDGSAAGPDRPSCEDVHLAREPALLALLERFVAPGGNVPAKDFLWRHDEDLRATGTPASVEVVREYHPGDASGPRVIDDFQAQPSTGLSSCGAVVAFSVEGVTEGILDDADATFEWSASDPFNGMTRNGADDDERGVTFSWSADSFYEMSIPAGMGDLRGHAWLSFRAGQVSRAPETAAELADLALAVRLTDGAGRSSAIRIDAYGAGLGEPYQRKGCPADAGAGWQGELEVTRIRLDDFRNEGTDLDLADVRSVRFETGPSTGAPQGRIVLDDVQFER